MAKLKELYDAEEKGEMPSCEHDCPLLEQPMDDDIAEAVCNDCWLHSDEYIELTTYSSLFERTMELIARRNAGLPLNPDELSYKEEQALLVTHAALEKMKADTIKERQKKPEVFQSGNSG